MRDLIILGAGVHAGEMAEIVERVNAVSPRWNLLGCVDTNDQPRTGPVGVMPVLGGPGVLADHPDADLVPDNTWKRTRDTPTDRLVSLIDPSCFVSKTATIGRGTVLYPGGYVGLHAKVGSFVFCLSGAVINHDNVIGDGVTLASKATCAGHVEVGNDAYLGQSCTIRQFIKIGEKTLIGMGAVVVKDVPAEHVMIGNPAQPLVKSE